MPDSPVDAFFERLRDRLESLGRAGSHDARELVWADDGRHVALARDEHGRVEVFVVGAELVASTRVVRDNLVHHSWAASDGSVFDASRVVFPADAHFDGVAALVCTELVRHGVARDTQSAFARTEPVVALALRRAAIGDAAIVGLAGELLVLDALLNVVTPGAVPDVLDAWKGSAPSSRDFQLGDVGVEVKTTTASDSVHHVTGVHQVEPGASVDGTPESALYLLSLGIRWLGRGATGGFTLPGLVDSVVARAHGAGVTEAVVDQLLSRVRQYGGDAGLGYDHASDSQLPRFLQPFEVRFERLYDMGDDDIHVLDSASLAGATHVDASTVEFTVRLPRRVRGDVNPVSGLRQIARAVTARAHLPTKQA